MATAVLAPLGADTTTVPGADPLPASVTAIAVTAATATAPRLPPTEEATNHTIATTDLRDSQLVASTTARSTRSK